MEGYVAVFAIGIMVGMFIMAKVRVENGEFSNIENDRYIDEDDFIDEDFYDFLEE